MARDDARGLRLEIAGSWSAAEMAMLLGDLSLLYEVRFGIERSPDRDLPPWLRYGWPWPSGHRQRLRVWQWGDVVARWPSEAFESQFDIVRIRYGSPGLVDLAGLGKVVEQIRLFIEKIIDLKATRRGEELENASLQEDIIAKKIKNARDFVRLM